MLSSSCPDGGSRSAPPQHWSSRVCSAGSGDLTALVGDNSRSTKLLAPLIIEPSRVGRGVSSAAPSLTCSGAGVASAASAPPASLRTGDGVRAGGEGLGVLRRGERRRRGGVDVGLRRGDFVGTGAGRPLAELCVGLLTSPLPALCGPAGKGPAVPGESPNVSAAAATESRRVREGGAAQLGPATAPTPPARASSVTAHPKPGGGGTIASAAVNPSSCTRGQHVKSNVTAALYAQLHRRARAESLPDRLEGKHTTA